MKKHQRALKEQNQKHLNTISKRTQFINKLNQKTHGDFSPFDNISFQKQTTHKNKLNTNKITRKREKQNDEVTCN